MRILLEQLRDSTFIQAFKQGIERVFNVKIPKQAKVIYRILIASLSLILASLFLPYWLVPFFYVMSVILLFLGMAPIQSELFEFERQEIHWFITTPFYLMFVGWGYLMIILERPQQINYSLGSYVLLVVVSIWPVYRMKKNFERRERSIPYHVSFWGFASVMFIQQIFVFWRNI